VATTYTKTGDAGFCVYSNLCNLLFLILSQFVTQKGDVVTPEQLAIWLRLVFTGPATMNPWLQFWLNAVAPVENERGRLTAAKQPRK
jgi:hypothetical protein